VIADHKPGSIFIIDPSKILNEDVSTHRMPLSMLYRFLKESIGCEVMIIGIEPERVYLDIGISKNVKNSIELLANIIKDCLKS